MCTLQGPTREHLTWGREWVLKFWEKEDLSGRGKESLGKSSAFELRFDVVDIRKVLRVGSEMTETVF